MSTTTNGTGVPAGWYPDPIGAASHRWWDGAAWTPAAQNRTEPKVPLVEEPVAEESPAESAPLRSGGEVHARLGREPHAGLDVAARPATAPAADFAPSTPNIPNIPAAIPFLPAVTPPPPGNPAANRALA